MLTLKDRTDFGLPCKEASKDILEALETALLIKSGVIASFSNEVAKLQLTDKPLAIFIEAK